MNKLMRYLVLLAGTALAMLLAVPSASAVGERPDNGPDSRACHVASRVVDEAKKVLEGLEKQLKPVVDKLEHKVSELELLAKLKALPDPKHIDVVNNITLIEKLLAAKRGLFEVLFDKFKVCQPGHHPNPGQAPAPAAEHPEQPAAPAAHEAGTADFSQVHDVPVGSVDTGGGPA